MNQQLINFYTAKGKDSAGRTHADILAMTNEELEATHDFIQWLFPTVTPSAFNKNAPVLDPKTASTLSNNKVFLKRFNESLQRMFDFLDLPYQVHWEQCVLHPVKEKLRWMEYDNHNLLRLSRIMESLRLLGFKQESEDLFRTLIKTIKNLPDVYYIELENVYFWYLAAYGG